MTATFSGDLSVSAKTYLYGDLTVNGSLLGTGFTSLVSSKENQVTTVAPLQRTTVIQGGTTVLTQLSLDTTAAYTVGSLASSGLITCGSLGTGTSGLSIKNQVGNAVATF